MLGIGVMFSILESEPADLSPWIGKRITAVEFSGKSLILTFETDCGRNNKRLKISDEGQSCCEERFMRTDDDPQSLVGHQLLNIEVKPSDNIPTNDDWGEHEVCFVDVTTSGGFVSISTHNIHNGYYGGFALYISDPDQPSEDA